VVGVPPPGAIDYHSFNLKILDWLITRHPGNNINMLIIWGTPGSTIPVSESEHYYTIMHSLLGLQYLFFLLACDRAKIGWTKIARLNNVAPNSLVYWGLVGSSFGEKLFRQVFALLDESSGTLIIVVLARHTTDAWERESTGNSMVSVFSTVTFHTYYFVVSIRRASNNIVPTLVTWWHALEEWYGTIPLVVVHSYYWYCTRYQVLYLVMVF